MSQIDRLAGVFYKHPKPPPERMLACYWSEFYLQEPMSGSPTRIGLITGVCENAQRSIISMRALHETSIDAYHQEIDRMADIGVRHVGTMISVSEGFVDAQVNKSINIDCSSNLLTAISLIESISAPRRKADVRRQVLWHLKDGTGLSREQAHSIVSFIANSNRFDDLSDLLWREYSNVFDADSTECFLRAVHMSGFHEELAIRLRRGIRSVPSISPREAFGMASSIAAATSRFWPRDCLR